MERTLRRLARLSPEDVAIIDRYPIEHRLVPLRNEIYGLLETLDRSHLPYRDFPKLMDTIPEVKDILFRLLLMIQLLPAAQHLRSPYTNESVLVSLSKLIPRVSDGDINREGIGNLLDCIMHIVTDGNIWLRVFELLGQPHDIIVIAEYNEETQQEQRSSRHKKIKIPYRSVGTYEEIVEIARKLRDPFNVTVTNATYTFIQADDWHHCLEGPEPVFLLRFKSDDTLTEPKSNDAGPDSDRILIECFNPQSARFSSGLYPHSIYFLNEATIPEIRASLMYNLSSQTWEDDDFIYQRCSCNRSPADVVLRYSNAVKLESYLLEDNNYRSMWDYRIQPGAAAVMLGPRVVAVRGGKIYGVGEPALVPKQSTLFFLLSFRVEYKVDNLKMKLRKFI
ncbi:hypothetical protein RUND412_010127 [Rhizina undulata]